MANRLIYELPEPLYGETHVNFFEVRVVPGVAIYLTGNLGSMSGRDFEWSRNLDFPVGWVERNITGDEFKAFLRFVDAQRGGAPTEGTSNFRDSDIAHWLNKYGWRGKETNDSWHTDWPA